VAKNRAGLIAVRRRRIPTFKEADMKTVSGLRFCAHVLGIAPVVVVIAAGLIYPAAIASAAPTVGDTYVYRVVNAYNNEVRGKLSYRVEEIAADRIVMAMTSDVASLGPARTVTYAKDGNWLRHPLTNHDTPVDYEFSQAYPAYVFPLEIGKSWSVRVNALNPATGQQVSVRVDGEVLGAERVVTPAGSFDTFKVMRRVYAGDWEAFRRETNIVETDWYAPQLGRPVKSEMNSGYMDSSRCGRGPCRPIRGDWSLFELVESTAR
jgi:hypothetical protein